MKILLVIFLLGLGIKAIVGLTIWVWDVVTDAFNFSAPETARSSELRTLRPMEYFRVRSGRDPKLRRLPPDGRVETRDIPIVKKSA